MCSSDLDEPNDLALVDVEGHGLQCDDAAEADREIANGQDRGHGKRLYGLPTTVSTRPVKRGVLDDEADTHAIQPVF